nr:uncharacterized mitochondrial protein AtMg00820-like [Nicotiana tomentosiformis]
MPLVLGILDHNLYKFILLPIASSTCATSSVIPTSFVSSPIMHDVFVFPSEISANVTSAGSDKRHVHTDPNTYSQAASSSKWQYAMKKEFEALEANGTWDIIEIPLGKKPIGCKWVYKVKYKVDGTIERYEVRLVIREDTQVEG